MKNSITEESLSMSFHYALYTLV